MPFQSARWILGVAVLFATARPSPARAQTAVVDTIVEWNRLLQVTVAGTPTPTVFFTRPYAMTSIAMFDALNAIERMYQPYLADVEAGANASRQAAIAQAAHDVLVALYPSQRAALDAALATSLAGATGGIDAGVQVGAAVARAVIEARRHDGWDRPVTSYLLPDMPGYYQVTPPQNATVTFTHYPDVQPFVVDRNRSLVAAPPALTSATYAEDFNEVKALGSASSSVRTAEQTSIAQRWAGIGTSTPFQVVWHNVLRDLARRTNMSAIDFARTNALLYAGMHDGLLASFNGKFLYGLWRPVTAIRQADRDGNPNTVADPTWLSLIANPPYPTYPGNMTCMGAVASRTLQRAFGRDDVAFNVTWTATAGGTDITRPFNGFRELANEQARSRVYGGIHFEFDQLASFGVCSPLADYAFDNYMRPRGQ
jgi:hypothetical protein